MYFCISLAVTLPAVTVRFGFVFVLSAEPRQCCGVVAIARYLIFLLRSDFVIHLMSVSFVNSVKALL